MIGAQLNSSDTIQVVRIEREYSEEEPYVLVLQMKTKVSSPYVLESSEVEEIIGLWNALPESEQARCHIPGYAIQIVSEGVVTFTATICWECNNIHIYGDNSTISGRQFDSKSRSAKRLLKFCKRKLP